MWRLIKFLWTGSLHVCKWETIQHGKIVEHAGSIPVGRYFYLRCKECGKHKKETLHT